MTRHRSAMCETFGWLQGQVARWLTADVHVDARDVARVRKAARSGTVVYVVRQRSLLDYMLINWILLREGLPIAEFANGLGSAWFAPVRTVLGRLKRRLGNLRAPTPSDREAVAEAIEDGRPILVFLRARSTLVFGDARTRLAAARPGADLLSELVAHARKHRRSIQLVPLSLFRGRAIRRQAGRLSNFAYSFHDAPNDLKKFFVYAFNRDDLLLRPGAALDLEKFLSDNRRLGQARLARRLTHRLQRELAYEERAVWGPLIVPRETLAERIFEGRDARAWVEENARERGISQRRAWREARRYFWEMAANFNGMAFGILSGLFVQIWKRAFSGVEIRGLDEVAKRVKEAPVVLVPCHRSHFDYMVLSYIFKENFLSPPHIAAGINLKFWPMGPFLRGAGAFFIRRSFEDNDLYKFVFHRYLTTLIRFGYTMEFFIEGGRSRTGKMLTPKLGLLGGIVRAFLQGARRDLYLVPISIHYGRIAEENAYDAERSGEEKQKESFGALLRARSVLSQRHGTVYVTFAEPRSLRKLLGDRAERFATADKDEDADLELRRFVQKLGFQILRDVNEVAVVGATSLTATVLLGAPRGARSDAEFQLHARALSELLRWQGVTFTSSLERNLATPNFGEIKAFLTSASLVEEVHESGDTELRVRPEKRTVLDFYKNNSIHFFLLPALVAHAVMRGVPREELEAEVLWWLDLFRWEFPLPERDAVGEEVLRILDYLRAHGAGGRRSAAQVPLIRALVGILENFREGYWIVARTAAQLEEEPVPQSRFQQRLRRYFDAARLLGEVLKPEASSDQTFGNAISRMVEMGMLERETPSGRKGRDPMLRRGPAFDEFPDLVDRIGSALVIAREPSAREDGVTPIARMSA
jgi:glycerol-3-phosphate O-acyltransferase